MDQATPQAITPFGENLHAQRNLVEDNEMRATYRNGNEGPGNITHHASTYIPDEVANNNPDVVIRDGSRFRAGGEYQPGDMVLIDGMEVPVDTARSLGLMPGSGNPSPQEALHSDAENTAQPEAVEDTRPEEAQLLEAQLQVAVGDRASAVLDTVGKDITENGGLSDVTLKYAQDELGMSPESAARVYQDMQQAGGRVMADFMNTGDGHEGERMEFLVDLAHNGTRQQQEIVRNLWFMAATGKLTRKSAGEAFDYLWKPYE